MQLRLSSYVITHSQV